jgi:signal transduction histidine kinase
MMSTTAAGSTILGMGATDRGIARLRAAAAVLAPVIGALVIWQKHLLSPSTAGLLAVLACVVPFLVDARRPQLLRAVRPATVAVVVVLAAAAWLMAYRPTAGDPTVFFFILVAARVAAGAPTTVSAPLGLLAVVLPEVASTATGWHEYPAAVAGTAFAWVAGFGMRQQAALTNQLVAARAAAAQHQIAAERQQLAREVHDLVGHTLAVTMLHLSALRLSLDDGEIDEARESLGEAQRAGREAMREMRQAVTLLGGSPPDGPSAPLPQASDLPDLVAGYASAGLDVTLDLAGDLGTVSGDAGLAAYRIVQESLTNAAKHAGESTAAVAIHVNGTDVEVTVVNDLPRPVSEPATVSEPAQGHGLPGMERRASLLGGTFFAGAEADRWRVHARLPVNGR